MKITNRWLWILLPLVTGSLCAAYIGLTTWRQTHFACDSQLAMVDSKGREDVILHFRFAGKTGHVETKGKYITLQGEVIPTSNKVSFTFWREDDALVMVSDDTSRFPKISPPVLGDAPDFFTTRERGLRLQMVRKNASGYLFLYEGTPALYCTLTP